MKQYGLIGYPLSHSFSKNFFTEKFKKEAVDACYTNFEIDSISRLPMVIKSNPELIGLNVTIPYKEQVIPYLDELDAEANEVGAVNTIKIIRFKKKVYLKGFNTDTWGFENALKPLLKDFYKNALILGTGGASKAVRVVLRKLGISFISATTKKPGANEISYSQIDKQCIQKNQLIINATPLGTYPGVENFPPIPYEYLTDKHLLFDLVYNPEITKFMEKGKQKGALVKNGYEMLLGQALKSYEIWER